MSKKPEDQKTSAAEPVSIADLYPSLTESEQEEAAYFLNRYLDLIERIYNRLNS